MKFVKMNVIVFQTCILLFSFHYSLAQIPQFTITCNAYDTDTKKPVVKSFVDLWGSDGSHIKKSVDEYGHCIFNSTEVKSNVNYKIECGLDGYLTKLAKVSTIGYEYSYDFVFEFNFPIYSRGCCPGRYDKLKATFGFRSFELSADFKEELDRIANVLIENPTIVMQIKCFVDKNEKLKKDTLLSFRRNLSITNYLVEKRINKKRLECVSRNQYEPFVVEDDYEFPGFSRGDVFDEKTIKNLPSKTQKDMAHQLNRRAEFEIIRTDFFEKE